jgi:hypothetical protein
MPFRHAIIDADATPCGVVVCSAITGKPTSAIERILRRARCRVDALDARGMATALDPFGLSLWLTGGFEEPVPLEVWLYARRRAAPRGDRRGRHRAEALDRLPWLGRLRRRALDATLPRPMGGQGGLCGRAGGVSGRG